MPRFTFQNEIEPVEVEINGEVYRALPAIPANDFFAFMDLFARIPLLVAKIQGREEDGDQAALPAGQPAQPSTSTELVPIDDAPKAPSTDERMGAYRDFIRLSLDGLDMVMQPESLSRLQTAMSDKEKPIPAETLVEVFSTLAGYYISGGRESEEAQGSGPTEGGNELSPSSDTTGGSSADGSSAESAPPNSPDGPTTT